MFRRIVHRAVFLWLWLALLLAGTGRAQDRPNVLLIMADDMGYSDLGSFGGEIETPHLNRLAAQGLRFTDFYNTGRCCPSRASLLTGLYPHQVSLGWMTAADLGRPGYGGELSPASATLAEVLSASGYGTYMAGKWHLTRYDHEAPESPKDSWPRQRGFDRFYGSLRGGSYYAPETLVKDNDRITAPARNYHYTDAISQRAGSFLEAHMESSPNKPFFCYLAYTAPHWPLHAAEEDVITKYREVYAAGWDVLRRERFNRMHHMRLLEPRWSLPQRPDSVPAWESLSEAQREELAHRMAIYAAQIERMDHGIGQIVQLLEEKDQLDNTLIVFVADNGASAEGGPFGFERLEGGELGKASSFASYGKGWATLSNTPFREYKHWVHEGGIATPCIVHWPDQIFDRGRVRTTPAHFIDLMPTVIEVAQAAYPESRGDQVIPPMEGRSLLDTIKGMSSARRPIFWEHEGNRALRQGPWKLVAKHDRPWELYHLDDDRTETNDVAGEYPSVTRELSGLWQTHAKRTQVLPLDGRPWGERVPPAPAAPPAIAPGPQVEPNLPEGAKQPNLIVILCDDLGYGDLGCYGSSKHRTPHLDRMAEEGVLLTNFYSASGFCTPSRAALLTGCYAQRIGLHMNYLPPGTSTMRQVLFPVARRGLHPDEITIADALRPLGYATACIGKWHLGDQKSFLPTRQGFEEYFGIPYSNDMGAKQFPVNPPLPLLRGEKVIEAPVDQATITRRYTEEAIKFIRKSQERPFFLYLPHTMPHNPVYVSEEFKDKSEHGLYASCVEELDWSTGQILETLDELELAENTLVAFTSDNGAARAWGGGNAPLPGFKGTVSEGGMRVPCIARWTGRLPGGHRANALTSTIDLLPTFLRLAGGELPAEQRIDGHDIWPILSAEDDAKSPHAAFYYYQQDQLQAIRRGKWKLYLQQEKIRQPLGRIDTLKDPRPARLYDLEKDSGEKTDLADAEAEIVAELTALAEKAKDDLGDLEREGSGVRPPGMEARPEALKLPE